MSDASPLSIDEAREIQLELAKQVSHSELPSTIRTIAGFDIAYMKSLNRMIAGMVVLEFPSLTPIGETFIFREIEFPYIPGYLSFREAPALLELIRMNTLSVDVYIFDGHGVAHPRGLGIASHIGVLIAKPAIGCAKKKLVGKYDMPAASKGARSDVIYRDRVVGCALRTRDNVRPVFISVGHKTELGPAVDLIMRCTGRYRIPEPTRLAHNMVTRKRIEFQAEGV
jgi:deoxyribonuclease V